ncbi:MAG: hypothetical protein A2722_04470 [Candidatus Doudnabacteria bacterium RIFCSPHIGHO2_01_FULL_50_11]|uniref:Uncharacterized protein n=1 Tax=Candidatus Doudnabacteria bacterium RIFCSPHIGHO2_01_FULL_50_11 TaxID=1817828 RepID=A0A1F5PGF3_9BACT|nr:MAG: hypothetical protein A2722_04470 [Candidatus Doudnabacteria bacterium RIFCSPHIGHO2_01_FULL_50_11]HLC44484.1 diacylglycerol kinase family protein [Patescibacteria group bacterium]
MYYYLVDPKQFDGKNFEFHQSRLLSLLGEYQVAGETARVTKLRTVEDLVATALSHGASTLVVVGSDETFSKVLTACRGKPLTLGFIPLAGNSGLKGILGIGDLADSVATIAKRRVEALDIAKIGPTHFISNVYFGPPTYVDPDRQGEGEGFLAGIRQALRVETVDIEMVIDGSYTVTNPLLGASIINARDNSVGASSSIAVGNPKDELLDVVFASKLGSLQVWRNRGLLKIHRYEQLPGGSIIHARKIQIKGPDGLPVYLAGSIIARAPVTVELSPEKVRVIVGRSRQF